jgi:hypothetical protein
MAYTAGSASFSYGAADAGDPAFGVSELGTWHACVEVEHLTSDTVSWEVRDYQSHITR